MRRYIALASLVLAVVTTACGTSADAKEKQAPLCGTIDTLFVNVEPNLATGSSRDSLVMTSIRFKDGRPLRFIGIPKIDVFKGKIYAFPVEETYGDGTFRLSGDVYQVTACGEIRKDSVSSTAAAPKKK